MPTFLAKRMPRSVFSRFPANRDLLPVFRCNSWARIAHLRQLMSHLCTPDQHVASIVAATIPLAGLELESADLLQDEFIVSGILLMMLGIAKLRLCCTASAPVLTLCQTRENFRHHPDSFWFHRPPATLGSPALFGCPSGTACASRATLGGDNRQTARSHRRRSHVRARRKRRGCRVRHARCGLHDV